MKKKNIQYEESVQLLAFVFMNHYFHRLLISSLHTHPEFVYKLGIKNYEQYQMKRYE